MYKINLQLFAQKLNTGTSIVDYLKSQGQDSSMSARKQIAESLGIKNYTGTYEQNVQMLNSMKNTGNNAVVNNPQPVQNNPQPAQNNPQPVQNNPQPVQNGGGTLINGVDDVTANNLKQSANATSIVGQETWDKINTPFTAPDGYTQAMNLTNGLLEKLTSGRTSYSDKVDAMIEQIMNRDKFEYDVDQDMLFQQALSSAMGSGKSAMQDTIGQASALTGGYASTYATSAGNQAYNAYIQDAYNNLPEYYQMAMQAYQMEGEDMYNQLGMLSDADANEYERLYNSWNANNANAQQIYQNAYTEWADSVNNALQSAGLQIDESNSLFDRNYKYAGLLNSDYWDSANFTEGQRQFNEGLAWEKDSFGQEMGYKYTALAQDDEHYYAGLKQDDEHYYAGLSQEDAQFLARYDLNGDGTVNYQDTDLQFDRDNYQFNGRYDLNGDGVVDSKDSDLEFERSIQSKADSGKGTTKTLSDDQYVKGLEMFEKGQGSYDEFVDRLLRLGYSEEEIQKLNDHVATYGEEPNWLERFFSQSK